MGVDSGKFASCGFSSVAVWPTFDAITEGIPVRVGGWNSRFLLRFKCCFMSGFCPCYIQHSSGSKTVKVRFLWSPTCVSSVTYVWTFFFSVLSIR